MVLGYISTKISLQASIHSLSDGSDYSSKENLELISSYVNSYIQYHITTFLYKTAKEYNSDIIGFGRYVVKNFVYQKDWDDFNWLENYKNSFFNVSVNTNIENSSLILKN